MNCSRLSQRKTTEASPVLQEFSSVKDSEKKVCGRCKIEKSRLEFGLARSRKSGLKSICKSCEKQDYMLNRDKRIEYDRRYYLENADRLKLKSKESYHSNVEKGRETRAIYAAKTRVVKRSSDRKRYEVIKEDVLARRAEYRKNHPEIIKAQSLARYRLLSGRSTKPDSCPSCGKSDSRLEEHHPDYTQPLLTEWLCNSCHKLLHYKLRKETNGSNVF